MSAIENLQLVSWGDIRERVQVRSPQLAHFLDACNPSKKFNFVLASYPYGVDIIQDGKLFVPGAGNTLVRSDDPSVSAIMNEVAGYSRLPVSLLLEKSIEAFYQTQDTVVCENIFNPGDIFGLWELFERKLSTTPASRVKLSSGARSLFMLPMISDQVSHLRLKRHLNVRSMPPLSLLEHRDLFAEVNANANGDSQAAWRCDVLYFGKEWFNSTSTKSATELENYFYKIAWEQSYISRLQSNNNVTWNLLLKRIRDRNLYLPQRILSQIKQIFLIAAGVYPGMNFCFSDHDQMAPCGQIAAAYQDIYRLKQRAPIFMHPSYKTKTNSVYYSLNYPSFIETSLPSKRVPRLMDELRIIKNTIATMVELGENFVLPPQSQFDYFHPAGETQTLAQGDVDNLSTLIANDAALARYFSEHDESFSLKNAYFKACVKIS